MEVIGFIQSTQLGEDVISVLLVPTTIRLDDVYSNTSWGADNPPRGLSFSHPITNVEAIFSISYDEADMTYWFQGSIPCPGQLIPYWDTFGSIIVYGVANNTTPSRPYRNLEAIVRVCP